MRKHLKKILVLSFSLICLISYSQYSIQKVVIDAGHGGKDPGALGKIGKEKNITLSIALKVGKYIEERIPGVEVIYTRKTDIFIPLDERAEIANKNKADLFISIHVNANTNKDATGTDSWVMGYDKSEKNLEVAKMENQVILVEENHSTKYQGLDPNSTEAYIIFDLMQNVHLEQSLFIASQIQTQFSTRAGRKSRGVKQAPFFVLWNTTMPSVLVETGFISNEAEEQFLLSETGQDYIASSIFRAFRDYKTEYDKKSNAPIVNETQTQIVKDSLFYTIQILSSRTSITLTDKAFKDYKDIFEFESEGSFKYLLGKSSDYKEIDNLKNIIKKDFPEAFIIAIKNGQKIPVQDALKLQSN